MSINSIKYSVVIPAYNSQDTMSSCLDSLKGLNHDNFEVIIVDDDSTDNTANICKAYLDNSSLFKYVKIKNKGVSNARNIGLSMAKGTWVTFVDSDDYIFTDKFTEALNLLSEDIDMLMCNYQKTGEKIDFSKVDFNKEAFFFTQAMLDYPNANMIFKDCDMKIRSMLFAPVWGKFYRRDIIEKNNIRFNTNLFLSEDLIFNLQYLEKCGMVKFFDCPIYSYYVNPNSVTHTFSNSYITNRISLINLLFDYFGIYKNVEKSIQRHIVFLTIQTITLLGFVKDKSIYSNAKQFFESSKIKELLKSCDKKNLSDGKYQDKYYRVLACLLERGYVTPAILLGKLYSIKCK